MHRPSPARFAAALILLAGPLAAQAPARSAGPVIRDFGAVFDIADPDFATPVDRDYRVVFDVADAAPSPDRVNARLETVARFLNMHARAGVPVERLHAVLVVHGTAGQELLQDAAYRVRNGGTPNPNAELIARLTDAGVQVVLCGQTATSRDLPRDSLLPGVQMALSAMTALITLQNDGYALIPW